MKLKQTITIAALTTLACASFAQIAATSGQLVEIGAPASVALGAYENGNQFFVFEEAKNLNLSSDLALNFDTPGNYLIASSATGGSVLAGSNINSYYVHADVDGLTTTGQNYFGSVTFTEEILGVIIFDKSLDATDWIGASATTYPTGVAWRGMELDGTTDWFRFSADRRTLDINMRSFEACDNMRVITSAPVPEPASMFAMGIGGVGVLIRRMRKSNS